MNLVLNSIKNEKFVESIKVEFILLNEVLSTHL